MTTARTLSCILMMTCLAACQGPAETTLKDAYRGRFLMGAAIGRIVDGRSDPKTLEMVARQFNSISSENMLKWGPFNPRPGQYNYGMADAYVAFGVEHEMYVVGHVLFWHNQTPDWVFQDGNGQPLSRGQLLDRMRRRVRHVAERYGDRIDAWDVVNEAFSGDGQLRQSKWVQIIGDDYIEQAFRIADEELPETVELIYNDCSMTIPRRRAAVVAMVRDLKSKGVRIDGVGMQGHWSLDGPLIKSIEDTIVAFAETGVDVHITELDINVLPGRTDPYQDGLPDEVQQKLANRYAGIFEVFIRHADKIKRVTFWGPSDRYSWLNNRGIKGRTNHPLLFDRNAEPKPAFHAVMDVAEQRADAECPS